MRQTRKRKEPQGKQTQPFLVAEEQAGGGQAHCGAGLPTLGAATEASSCMAPPAELGGVPSLLGPNREPHMASESCSSPDNTGWLRIPPAASSAGPSQTPQKPPVTAEQDSPPEEAAARAPSEVAGPLFPGKTPHEAGRGWAGSGLAREPGGRVQATVRPCRSPWSWAPSCAHALLTQVPR